MRILSVFTRNFRLYDNPIFEGWSKNEIIPILIVDSLKLLSRNTYQTEYLVNVIRNFEESLKHINSRLYKISLKNLPEFLDMFKPELVRVSFDVDKETRSLLSAIELECSKRGITFEIINDFLTTFNKDFNFRNFAQFFKKKFSIDVSFPMKIYDKPAFLKTPKFNIKEVELPKVSRKEFLWGTSENHALLHFLNFKKTKLSDYEKLRDIPYLQHTSKASVYLRWGLLSYRQVFYEGRSSDKFILELAWSDFNRYILFSYSDAYRLEIKENWRGFPWSNDESLLNLWAEARTGFPLVDAGMKELQETGFMHNRVRLITASFLTKNLFIDWRLGEKYFGSLLLDYDASENICNWQWVAGCGLDAAPYFRIFNPVIQAKEYDHECKYIKKYLPELKEENCQDILSLSIRNLNYPKPVVDLKESRERFLFFAKNFLKDGHRE